jgi:hypothetical protein
VVAQQWSDLDLDAGVSYTHSPALVSLGDEARVDITWLRDGAGNQNANVPHPLWRRERGFPAAFPSAKDHCGRLSPWVQLYLSLAYRRVTWVIPSID